MRSTSNNPEKDDLALARAILRRFPSRVYDDEDLVQDAWVARLSKNQWTKRAMIDALRRWYGSTGFNHRFHNTPSVLPKDLSIACSTAEDLIFCKEREEIVRHALVKLTESKRRIAYLYWFEGLSLREIAEVIGCNSANVFQHLNRVKRQLREAIPREVAA